MFYSNNPQTILEGEMAETRARVNNRKYIIEKRRKDAAAAIGFLLPNFLGFMTVTFFPIFATFALSFTEWDGQSKRSTSELRVTFATEKPAEANIALPSEGKIIYTYPQKELWQKDVTLPYVTTKDIVIKDQNTTVGIADIISIKEWDYNAEEQIIKVPDQEELLELSKKYDLKLAAGDIPYIKPGKIFMNQDNLTAVNPRFAQPLEGIGQSMAIDMSKSGKELNVITKNFDSEVVIPKGSVILADVYIDTVVSIETQRVEYLLSSVDKKGALIKKGETESKKIPLESVQLLKLHSDNPVTIQKYITVQDIPSNLKVEIKNVVRQGNNGIKWVGFSNYKKILMTDSRFKNYLLNTLFFLVIVPIGMAISLILAMAMNQPLKGIVAFRVLYFLPVISNIVAVALVWRWILNADYGLLNQALRFIGIENPPQWFSHEWWARIAIVIVEVWKGAGYNMMLYLAGLQGIPHFLYEAADIDGASPWQQFWNVTWPLLGPTNFFVLIMGIIGGFQAFGTQFVLTNGGPKGATTTIVYYIYNNAFVWGKMGYATAIAVVLFAFVMIITAVQWKVNEGKVEY